MTSKQRAYLRGLANTIVTILILGKGGISDTVIAQADSALEARELIKGKVLENCESSSREAADAIAEALMRATGEKLKPMIYNDGSSPAADETAEPIDAFLSKLNKHNIDFIIEE